MERPSDFVPPFALSSMWGASYLLIKLGLESVPPLTLAATRIVLGAAAPASPGCS